MNARHTPTPYYVGAQNDGLYIVAGDPPSPSNDSPRHDAVREVIAHVFDKETAAFIVRACNSHDALIAALERYGSHGSDDNGDICDLLVHSNYPCTCGFDAALKLAKGE